jgi:hypothetical protein
MEPKRKEAVGDSPLPAYGGQSWGLELTPRQKAIWEYMIGFQRQNVMPPTTREVAAAFRLNSHQSVVGYIRALVKKGYVRHLGEKGRMQRYLAVFKDDRCPCCGRKPLGRTESSSKTNEPHPSIDPRDPVPASERPDLRASEDIARTVDSGDTVPKPEYEYDVCITLHPPELPSAPTDDSA